MDKVRLGRIQIDGLRKIFDGIFIHGLPIVADASVVVGVAVVDVGLDELAVVGDRFFEQAEFVVRESSVEDALVSLCYGVEVWTQVQRLGVELDGLLEVAPLSRCVALLMQFFGELAGFYFFGFV